MTGYFSAAAAIGTNLQERLRAVQRDAGVREDAVAHGLLAGWTEPVFVGGPVVETADPDRDESRRVMPPLDDAFRNAAFRNAWHLRGSGGHLRGSSRGVGLAALVVTGCYWALPSR